MRIRGFKHKHKETLYKDDGRNKETTETSRDRSSKAIWNIRQTRTQYATAMPLQEKKLGLKPMTQEWFKLWFGKPFWMGTPKFRGRKK